MTHLTGETTIKCLEAQGAATVRVETTEVVTDSLILAPVIWFMQRPGPTLGQSVTVTVAWED